MTQRELEHEEALEMTLFGSGENLVLQVLSYVDEVVRVTSHSDDEVLIGFRMSLRIPQGFSLDDIELDMVTT